MFRRRGPPGGCDGFWESLIRPTVALALVSEEPHRVLLSSLAILQDAAFARSSTDVRRWVNTIEHIARYTIRLGLVSNVYFRSEANLCLLRCPPVWKRDRNGQNGTLWRRVSPPQ